MHWSIDFALLLVKINSTPKPFSSNASDPPEHVVLFATHQSTVNCIQSQLILSLFPGIDLLGRGFEAEGFSVVRGPDLLTGGDIRQFHVPTGRFDGVIGGPPCPDFSHARHGAPNGYGLEMIEEYIRLIEEARPTWWLMENVPGVPNVEISGYSQQRIDLNARELGSTQNRLRHFQFGHRDNRVISIPRQPKSVVWEPCCLASESKLTRKRAWSDFCALQGLPDGIDLKDLTVTARYRAVGNGVPVFMAQALARAIQKAVPANEVALCGCGCGREVTGRAIFAIPACRKRMQRRREAMNADLNACDLNLQTA